jgi:hypothetical protein
MHLPAVSVRPAAARRLMSGNPIACGDLDGIAPAGEPVRVYLDGGFAAIGQADGDGWLRLRAVLTETHGA